jgi:hypothetical protein
MLALGVQSGSTRLGFFRKVSKKKDKYQDALKLGTFSFSFKYNEL